MQLRSNNRSTTSFRRVPNGMLGLAATAGVIILTALGPLMSYKPPPSAGEGSFLRQLSYLILFALSIFSARPFHNPRNLAVIPVFIFIALSYCWISLTWSIAPDVGFRRLILTSILIYTIFLCTAQNGYEKVVLISRIILVLLLFVNYVAVLGFPDFGMHRTNEIGDDSELVGAWRGIMMHKNFAGPLTALTIIFFALDARKILIPLRISVIIFALYFLHRTESKTSMGIGLSSVLVGVIFTWYNPRYRAYSVPLVMILFSLIVLLSHTYWALLLNHLNNPANFTGRTQIWPALIKYSNAHWMTGTGFGSFWNISDHGGPIFLYAKGWVTDMAEGHNGYLDLLVTVGFPGLVIIVFATIVFPLIRLLSSLSMPRGAGSLLLGILFFAAGHNVTESTLFERDAIVQVFLMFAIALIYKLSKPLNPKVKVTRSDHSSITRPKQTSRRPA